MLRGRRPRNRRVAALSTPPFVRLTCLALAAGILVLWMFIRFTSPTTPIYRPSSIKGLSNRFGKKGKNRIAIVIPFVGESAGAIPPYLELFCSAAAGSAALVDFLLIHNGVLDDYHGDTCPQNVQFISLGSTENLARHLVRVLDEKKDDEITVGDSKVHLAQLVAKHIFHFPYVLVEFKPALGYIFAEYLEGYSHWGYSDLDILFGDLERWITPDELNDFDIVTYGFGDQERVYLRGQFTFHRNNAKINQLWRPCDYLSHMDKRFAEVLTGEKKLHFESAEGCYSAAILERNDIKVKYAVKAFTDTDVLDTVYSHGLFVGTGQKKDKTVLYKAGSKADGKALERLPDTWFEHKDTKYGKADEPLLYEIGTRSKLPAVDTPDVKCMFWALKKYQSHLCREDIDSTDTVFWIDGQLYKQQFEKARLPGDIETAPFFHFQEYKRFFRETQLASFHRFGPVRTFVLSKEGVLPIYPKEYAYDKTIVPSPLGMRLRTWNGVKRDDRQQLPNRSYCLRSGPRKFPANPPAPQCQFRTSWQNQDDIQILSGAPLWTQVNVHKEITMVLTLQIQASQANSIEALHGLLNLIKIYLDRWQGQPSIILLHVAGTTAESEGLLRTKLGPGSDLSLYGLDTCLVGAFFSQSKDFVSRKALLNMAVDTVPTRWYVSGFELERGLVISHDSAFFAHRVSSIHEELDLPGSVFVIPQFGLANKESDFTLHSLVKNKEEGDLVALAKLDEGSCGQGDDASADDGSSLVVSMDNFWWKISEGLVTASSIEKINDEAYEAHAKDADRLQLQITEMLTENKHYSLFAMDISPIIMTDNLGPRPGMMSSEIAREVEEFGGRQCYNGLRLAQLATYGYSISLLAGAFALSTPTSRSVATADALDDESIPLGASRCDGCFLFDEEHEDILEDISKDERRRPAKAALLWETPSTYEPLFGHT